MFALIVGNPTVATSSIFLEVVSEEFALSHGGTLPPRKFILLLHDLGLLKDHVPRISLSLNIFTLVLRVHTFSLTKWSVSLYM